MGLPLLLQLMLLAVVAVAAAALLHAGRGRSAGPQRLLAVVAERAVLCHVTAQELEMGWLEQHRVVAVVVAMWLVVP